MEKRVAMSATQASPHDVLLHHTVAVGLALVMDSSGLSRKHVTSPPSDNPRAHCARKCAETFENDGQGEKQDAQ